MSDVTNNMFVCLCVFFFCLLAEESGYGSIHVIEVCSSNVFFGDVG